MKYTTLDISGNPRSYGLVPDAAHAQLQVDVDPQAVSYIEEHPPADGMVYVGGVWVADTAQELIVAKQNKRKELFRVGIEKENAGINVSGTLYRSDSEAQQFVLLMMMMVSLPGTFSTTWERADGTTVSLNAAQIRNIASALGSHVIGVRNTARDLKIQITAATTLAQVAAIHWPP